MIDLVSFLSNAENYVNYRKYIKENVLSKEALVIINDMEEWHSMYPSLDWDTFESWFLNIKHPTLKQEKVGLYQKIFDKLKTFTPNDILETSLIHTYVTRSAATEIYRIAQEVAEGNEDSLDGVTTVINRYHDIVGEADKIDNIEADWNMEEIYEATKLSGGLSWRLPLLNQGIGHLYDGDFYIVGARPDTGKTSFIASEATYMAQQLPDDKHVIWFNNEERKSKVQKRIIQAALGITNADMDADWDAAWAEYIRVMGRADKIKFIDSGSLSVNDVEKVLNKYNAGLIIFDQLWKLQGVKEATNDVHRMTLVFNYGREWAKKYAPVITVHQADGSAGGQEYLTMEQLYMSKCLSKGTLVRLHTGETKKVEDIVLNDTIMGMDSRPRKVLATAGGKESMYKITHKNGLSYTVNESHILTLKKTTSGTHFGYKQGDIADIPLVTFLKYSSMHRHFKGFTKAIEYKERQVDIPPYIMGLWLADGHSKRPEFATKDAEFRDAIEEYCNTSPQFTYKERTDGSCWYPKIKYQQGIPHPFLNWLKEYNIYGNKHIPEDYMINTKDNRLSLLAGLIDGDGNIVHKQHDYYEIAVGLHAEVLAKQIQEVALSVGFNSNIRKKSSNYCIHISGDVQAIPVRINRKKTTYSSKRDVCVSSLTIKALGEGEYYGFTVDGDSRYMLANYIPTHNTGVQGEADGIIMLGRSYDPAKADSRFIHIAKQKSEGLDPKMKNLQREVVFKPEIARFEEGDDE